MSPLIYFACKVNDKLLFEEQILHSLLAKYLAKRRKVDWTNMTSDGYTGNNSIKFENRIFF